jgi:hypothetical protein
MRGASEIILINVGLHTEFVELNAYVVWRIYIPPPLLGL